MFMACSLEKRMSGSKVLKAELKSMKSMYRLVERQALS